MGHLGGLAVAPGRDPSTGELVLGVIGDGGGHAGPDGSRAHGVDGHPGPAQLHGQAPGQADHTVLAGGVGRDVGGGAEALTGGDVHDAAVAVAAQVVDTGPGQAGLGGEVDRQGVLPGRLVARPVDGRRQRHAGAVDQDVDRPQALPDLAQHPVDGVGVGDVDRPGPAAVGGRGRHPVEGGHDRPVLGQEAGGGLPDATRRTGHHGHATGDGSKSRRHSLTLCGSSGPS